MKHYFPTSLATVDLRTLRSNIESIKSVLGQTKICSIMKADAYGHGAAITARYLDPYVDWFAVATMDEGVELRLSGVTKPILVLGVPSEQTAPAYISHNLTATISHPSHFSLLMDGTRYHLNVDTGMHRLGVQPDQYEEVRSLAILNQRLIASGIYSHLSTADDAKSEFVKTQESRFKEVLSFFPEIPLRHLLNSSGLFYHQLERFDMVRMGLVQWGYLPGDPKQNVIPEMQNAWNAIRKVLTWSSRIVETRKISRGEGVSYGARWKAPEDGFISTIPVGYADGLFRLASGKISVMLHHSNGPIRFPIVGSITMDYIMIFTGDMKISSGTKVDLLTDNGPDAWDWAQAADTIPFEVLTRLSNRVVREYSRDEGLLEAPQHPIQ